MKRLGIEMIVAYSPEARGRSELAFGTQEGRLPQELALAGIADMDAELNSITAHAIATDFELV